VESGAFFLFLFDDCSMDEPLLFLILEEFLESDYLFDFMMIFGLIL